MFELFEMSFHGEDIEVVEFDEVLSDAAIGENIKESKRYNWNERYYDAIGASTAAGQSGPFIDFMLTEIRDTLNRHRYIDKVPDKIPDKVPNKSESQVLEILLRSPHITAAAIAAEIGITDRAVRKIISSLKKQGLVERVGSNKSGYWIVKIR